MNESSDTLRIYTYPNSVLRAKAEVVKNIDGAIQDLLDGMLRTMYAAPGIGLAANQVGELQRVIVFDLGLNRETKNPCVLINPEIVESEGEYIYEEACLSVIDYTAEVKRKKRIIAKGLDRHGNPLNIDAEELLAVCLQHEIDHLNGTLFIDHISNLKRTLYKKKLKKMLKNG